MERFIADLVQGLDSGRIDRREFCKTVALAAAVYGAGDAAQAQAQRGFKVIGINHMSYTCPDYAKARDWYASVLNMKTVDTRDDGNRANLMFGPQPGKGGSFLVTRSPGSAWLPVERTTASAPASHWSEHTGPWESAPPSRWCRY